MLDSMTQTVDHIIIIHSYAIFDKFLYYVLLLLTKNEKLS